MKKVPLLVGCIALAFLPALGGFISRPGAWYRSLRKPPLQPPPWVFGPVWMLLYLSIGLAHYRFLNSSALQSRTTGNALYGFQLALNAAWTPLFFGMKAPRLALADIALLVVVVAATERAFRKASPSATRLLWPYFGWICFATYLNAGICTLNRN